MNTERYVLEGRLQEKRQKALEIKLKMEGLRDSIRQILDRYELIERLRTDVAARQAIELSALRDDYRDLLEDMAAMRRDLGIQDRG